MSETSSEQLSGCGGSDGASPQGNIASRLSVWARRVPGGVAVAEPGGRLRFRGPQSYSLTTFGELDAQSDRIARGLIRWGVRPGMRLVMLVPFSTMFIRLTFALLKAGAVVVLVDPGMGRRHLVKCLSDSEPDGFVAIPKAQAIRTVLQKRFPKATWNVTVGRRWFWGGKTLRQISELGADEAAAATGDPPGIGPESEAAIIFTTGSTGPPKGVAYTHGMFAAQVDLIRERYGIQPGSRDLACFPLFGLFDNVMGVTTIIPDMDPTRPAQVDPRRLHDAVTQWEIDQAFGSPALWHRVAAWCEQTGRRFPTLRRVLSAGAPVPASTLERLRRLVDPEAEICTPYGATEALPIASIESRQVISETGPAAAKGRGVCVGTRFPSIRWRVIAVDDGPIDSIEDTVEMPTGKIGELMVAGPVVSRRYAVRADQNPLHKVRDGDDVWHRMGDVGYLDAEDRFWFCGRKGHRVTQGTKTWFTVPCESVFNKHPSVYRTALVGRGEPGQQTPVIVVEPHVEKRPQSAEDGERLIEELRNLAIRNPLTRRIDDFRIYPTSLPVDIRHNSKIFREQLADWVNGIRR